MFMQLFNHVLQETVSKIPYFCSTGRRNTLEHCLKVMHQCCMLSLLNCLVNVCWLLKMIQLLGSQSIKKFQTRVNIGVTKTRIIGKAIFINWLILIYIWVAATQPDYHKYLCNKYNWNTTDPNYIQWHTFCMAYNHLRKPERHIIAKFNHNWLPLQMSHHVHSTLEQQYCPSCRGQQETANHFLQCTHTDWQNKWIDFDAHIQKHLIRNPILHDLQELLLTGLHKSCYSDIVIPPELQQQQQLVPIIAQQSAIGWQQLLHGQITTAWRDHICQHAPQINSYQFFAKIIQLGWQTVLQSWKTRNSHLHPPILTQTDRLQLRTSVEQIFHEAQQDPNLSHLITYTTIDDIMRHPTKYIRQWVTNSHTHMQNHKTAQEQQAKFRTPDIRQFLQQNHPPHANQTDKNLLRPP